MTLTAGEAVHAAERQDRAERGDGVHLPEPHLRLLPLPLVRDERGAAGPHGQRPPAPRQHPQPHGGRLHPRHPRRHRRHRLRLEKHPPRPGRHSARGREEAGALGGEAGLC